MRRAHFIVLSCFLLLLIAASCQKKTAEELLKERVSQYVESVATGNREKEYDFMPPSYTKEISKEKFIKRRKVKIEKIALKSIDYEKNSDKAVVMLLETLEVMSGYTFEDAPVRQNWILVDGQWYLDAKVNPLMELFNQKSSDSGDNK